MSLPERDRLSGLRIVYGCEYQRRWKAAKQTALTDPAQISDACFANVFGVTLPREQQRLLLGG